MSKMLISQLEERGRRFKLALRAGIPVLILVSLVFYSTIYNGEKIVFTIKIGLLLGAITFITIYFIYFLMNLSVQETLLDQASQSFNRRTFIKKLEQYQPKSIVYITIDNFSSIIEHYSHEQIDTLLYTMTSKLHLIFKQNGLENILIGRHGNAGFLIGLDDSHYNIQFILESLIEDNKSINTIEVDLKFAIITNTMKENFEKAIFQLQDIITSQTIENNKIRHSETTKDAKELSSIENCVIEAIKNKKLNLSFRPLLNTTTDIVDTYEIAVKLQSRDNKNSILPRLFLPIVNRLGLGREYDFALIKHVIDLLPLVDDTISFTFNLSPFSLRDSAFQKKLFDYLVDKKIDPSRLIIQLYERKTHHDIRGYLKTLQTFRANGMKTCIDNFGSSSASMEYMKHFKFDMVQFDRDYVTHLADETTFAMLQSLITMSKKLQVKTVAKWVDNDKQQKRLRELGIDYIQGFGVSRSVQEDELINIYN